ncbi:hypothetical protein B0J11DRAFT_296108 [Dendryphion nanum]|uniref:Protein kinase domain-containing protein n=1 Tax=Dendryphion nanum TaxID=256645 RepID=A0A9P9INU4_9PLEO|nr:hypothetical protein B0J11DRAFT_296108 [Dendryphion nanum]
MAEIFGTVITAINAFEIVLAVGKFLKSGIENAQSFGDDTGQLVIKMHNQQVRASQLKLLLFGELSGSSIKDEKGQIRPCWFLRLPIEAMVTVSDSLQECQRVTQRYHILQKYGFSTSEIRDAFGDDNKKQHSNTSYTTILKWAFHDKKKAVKMIAEYREWVEDVYQLVLGYFLAKEHDIVQLQALEENKEAQELEIAKSLRLKRIIESDPMIADNEVVLLELDMLNTVVSDNETTCSLNQGTFAEENVLLEFIEYVVDRTAVQGVPEGIGAQVERLAKLMQSPKPREILGLRSQGYVHQPGKQRFAFVYEFPGNMKNPVTINLSELLCRHTKFRPSLTRRLVLAHQLALAVLNLHTLGWVHKSLRSSNVVFFRSKPDWKLTSQERLFEPWLCGFEYSRPVDAETWKLADRNLLRNIYRHPRRWGKPTTKFEKEHDIYALGVMLLEIGLWEPAVSFERQGFKDWADEPDKVKERMLEHASKRLGFFAGEAYQRVVLGCLEGTVGLGIDGLRCEEALKEDVVDELHGLCRSEEMGSAAG